MNPETIKWLIIFFIVAEYAIERVLQYLNLKHWSTEVPPEMQEYYDEEKYRKAQAYNKENAKFSFISGTFSFLLILAVLLLDGFAWADAWVRTITEHPVWMTLLFFGILYLISTILSLPFSIYHTFVIEEKYGFNRTTAKTFLLDKIKGLLLTALLGGGILALIVLFYLWAGEWFWLYAWVAVTAITFFFTAFYTDLLVPLFNKLTPLKDEELKKAIEAYAAKVAFPLKNIYEIDGSKRSTKANAFFSGIGKKKSIVLFDTLIKEHSQEEIVAVLAHEVGHFKKKHVMKGFILSTLNMGIIFFLIGWFVNEPVLSEALGAEQHSFHLGLLAFGLLYSPVSMITGILMNIFSRKNEYEADDFAAKTYDATPLQKALKKLSVNHLSNLKPHPAYVFVHYSHPPLLKRVRAMERS